MPVARAPLTGRPGTRALLRPRAPAAVLLALLALALPAAAQLAVAGEASREKPPNIVLILADDMGVEHVAAYGEHPDPPNTPVLDQLAADGVLFRNCWVNPGCSPTRAAILTGRYAFRTGVGIAIAYTSSPFELSTDEVMIPAALDARYRTGFFGKWHLASRLGKDRRHPLEFGFDRFLGTMKNLDGVVSDAYYDWEKVVDGTLLQSERYATSETVDDALRFVHEADNAPWFVFLAFHAPHAPYHAPPRELHSYALPTDVSDDLPLAMYAMIEAMDTEIGRFLSSLPPGVRDDTYVIFVGDNGAPALVTTPPQDPKHAKNTVYEGGVNVPLIVSGPGVVRGAECAGLVNGTDLFATVLDLSARPTPVPYDPPQDSVTIVPYLTDPGRTSLRQWVYTERFLPNGPLPASSRRAMRDARFKLIQTLDHDDAVIAEELYDLVADPFETADLLAAPGGVVGDAAVAHEDLASIMETLDPPQPFLDLGGGAAASEDAPALSGGGVPGPGGELALTVTGAPPGAAGFLVVDRAPRTPRFADGLVELPRPRSLPVTADADGRVELRAQLPARPRGPVDLAVQAVFPGVDAARRASNVLAVRLR